MIEPHLHGGMASIDEVLNKFDESIREAAAPEDETWVDSEQAERNAEAFEARFPVPAAFMPHPEDREEG